jgi:ribosome biogenesis protein MAK21
MAQLLIGVNRAFPFSKNQEFGKHVDTLFEICHLGGFNTMIQALLLILLIQSSENNAKGGLVNGKEGKSLLNGFEDGEEGVSKRFYNVLYASLFDPRLVTSSKQSMYLNLVWKAIRNDDIARVKAFVKRLVQVLNVLQVPMISGILFLVAELFQIRDLESMLAKPIPNKDTEPCTEKTFEGYDFRKRDPFFAGANILWELLPFANHFHPTIALYARSILSRTKIPIQTNYDPLLNHTIQKFLDRFVYKNPKKVKEITKGSSIMQSRIETTNGNIVAGRRKLNVEFGDDGVEVKGEQRVDQRDVFGVDELFYERFFKEKRKHDKKEIVGD